jgi:hypothetical protein
MLGRAEAYEIQEKRNCLAFRGRYSSRIVTRPRDQTTYSYIYLRITIPNALLLKF